MLAALDTDGVVVSVNWRGHGDDPCGGDEAATILLNETHSPPIRSFELSHGFLQDRYADPPADGSCDFKLEMVELPEATLRMLIGGAGLPVMLLDVHPYASRVAP